MAFAKVLESKKSHDDKHISKTLFLLFQLRVSICLREREVLKTTLELIKDNPSSAHLIFGNRKGHMAVKRGDLLIVSKCVKADNVKARQTNHCYAQLPITHNSTAKFLDSSSKIIIDEGSLVDCKKEPSTECPRL